MHHDASCLREQKYFKFVRSLWRICVPRQKSSDISRSHWRISVPRQNISLTKRRSAKSCGGGFRVRPAASSAPELVARKRWARLSRGCNSSGSFHAVSGVSLAQLHKPRRTHSALPTSGAMTTAFSGSAGTATCQHPETVSVRLDKTARSLSKTLCG